MTPLDKLIKFPNPEKHFLLWGSVILILIWVRLSSVLQTTSVAAQSSEPIASLTPQTSVILVVNHSSIDLEFMVSYVLDGQSVVEGPAILRSAGDLDIVVVYTRAVDIHAKLVDLVGNVIFDQQWSAMTACHGFDVQGEPQNLTYIPIPVDGPSCTP